MIPLEVKWACFAWLAMRGSYIWQQAVFGRVFPGLFEFRRPWMEKKGEERGG
jgi:hypothetical protein